MCGVFGFFDPVKRYDQTYLKKMSQRLTHRGPDSFNQYIDGSAFLGFNRLSIVDLENGDQPFFSQDGRYVVFCNGEIYNFESLWQLVDANRKTNSDIEVLPHLFEKFGEDFVHKLRGIFAITIYDSLKKEFYIFRDQVGVKPLYYYFENGLFLYASELKAFMDFGLDETLSHEALHTYLDLMFIPSPFTPFEKVLKLEPGSLLKFSVKEEKLSTKKYLDIFELEEVVALTNNDEHRLNELLEEASKLNLLSDVPISTFLSGGIDSSIVTIKSAQFNRSITALHMDWGSLKSKVNETEVVEHIVDRYGLSMKSFVSNQIVSINKLPELIYALDEPNADAAFIPTFMLSKFASEEGFRVILSGAGGDELFGGYERYRKLGKWKGKMGKLLMDKDPNIKYDFLKKGFIRDASKILTSKRSQQIIEQINGMQPNVTSLNNAMLTDMRYYLCDNILMLTDKMTSWNSMECRVPLLHYELIEYAFKIEGSSKTAGGTCFKQPLKQYAENLIPKEFIYRAKEGFGFPIENWLNAHIDVLIIPFILDGYLKRNGLLNENYLLRQFFPYNSRNRLHLWRIWHIFVLEIWCQLFLEKKSYETLF